MSNYCSFNNSLCDKDIFLKYTQQIQTNHYLPRKQESDLKNRTTQIPLVISSKNWANA